MLAQFTRAVIMSDQGLPRLPTVSGFVMVLNPSPGISFHASRFQHLIHKSIVPLEPLAG